MFLYVVREGMHHRTFSGLSLVYPPPLEIGISVAKSVRVAGARAATMYTLQSVTKVRIGLFV